MRGSLHNGFVPRRRHPWRRGRTRDIKDKAVLRLPGETLQRLVSAARVPLMLLMFMVHRRCPDLRGGGLGGDGPSMVPGSIPRARTMRIQQPQQKQGQPKRPERTRC
ncbi:hypothetical protein [Streptomyces reniochalinae]|uniref:Uncharacterized protein n=1 Tax=Streptomyces reniochalinae TaxID=2250578 RepID=A0A367EBD1_9ACTN|nr:hypothetical protein [Streptomyces reniochalinae]RCG14965.1 hypothetical protein DQ392_28325 [Streptomyces reniochalinae]